MSPTPGELRLHLDRGHLYSFGPWQTNVNWMRVDTLGLWPREFAEDSLNRTDKRLVRLSPAQEKEALTASMRLTEVMKACLSRRSEAQKSAGS